MSAWLLSLISIVLIALAIVRGFRKGFRRQLPQLFGLLFGAVCAHIFRWPVESELMNLFPGALNRCETEFIYSTLACGGVFILCYLIFTLCTRILVSLFRHRESSILDSIGGALLTLVIYTTFMSLIFNLLICLHPRSELSASMTHSDANILSEVLMVAPAIIGSQSPEELAHLQQLQDARLISV